MKTRNLKQETAGRKQIDSQSWLTYAAAVMHSIACLHMPVIVASGP